MDYFKNLPRVKLGYFPTPFDKLERMSEETGVNIWIKRDDFSGRSLFGGNKIRKLEFLIGDALKNNAEYVFTYGATQSNHAMQTAAACRMCGLKPILYLTEVTKADETELKSNLLLDRILGAEVHIVRMHDNETEDDADDRAVLLARKHMLLLESSGHKCYEIPMGGANAIGSVGFAAGYFELMSQCKEACFQPDYIYHATGTAGTMAGLAVGRKLYGSSAKVVSVNVSVKTDEYLYRAAKLANETLEYLGIKDACVNPETDVLRVGDFCGEGYEIPTKESNEAIQKLAMSEGIIIDPVYTGKAFSALLAHIHKGIIPKGSSVVFWHTGGATALFAESQMVGKFEGKMIYDE